MEESHEETPISESDPPPPALPTVRVDVDPTDPAGIVRISYDDAYPPRVFFDTNVILGLGKAGEQALRRLKAERCFRFRFSMLNFVELLSHLDDPPSKETRTPFMKYQAAFRRVHSIFDGVLPSAESALMYDVGLIEHTGKNWIVDGASVQHQVEVIAKAGTLGDVRKAGLNPAHYKKLREIDANSFLGVVAEARHTIKDVVVDYTAGGRLLRRFIGFLIFRASSGAIRLETLCVDQQLAVFAFFERAGGKMFLTHFVKLLDRVIKTRAKDDANDFYDMLQLLLLRDRNLLFVTDDRAFFKYYAGAEHHRVVRWKGFKNS